MRIPSTTLRKGVVDKGCQCVKLAFARKRRRKHTHLVPLTPHSLPLLLLGLLCMKPLEHRIREEQRWAAPEKDF